MPRRTYRYLLNRRDAKLAGVCSTLGEQIRVDPTFLRVAFVAAAILISLKLTLVLYAGLGIWMIVKNHRESGRGMSEFDRMDFASRVRPSVHGMLHDLEPVDRQLMAIDNHLNTPNHELAREIEALKEDK